VNGAVTSEYDGGVLSHEAVLYITEVNPRAILSQWHPCLMDASSENASPEQDLTKKTATGIMLYRQVFKG